MAHTTVLQSETIDMLNLAPSAVVVDCTFGGGGHSTEILSHLGKDGSLLSLDVDGTAFIGKTPAASQTFITANFKEIKDVVAASGHTSVDAIVADLGWRSDQFAEGAGKGFSFQYDEPLLMTFGDPEKHIFTAHDVVNEWEEASLADVIYHYGEERAARRIAKAIVEAREAGEITTSGQLADIVGAAAARNYRGVRIHPATRTFQAIRMVVNDELNVLKTLLLDGFTLLSPGGRMAIITFHSLEDRLVKHTYKEFAHDFDALIHTKKPITPSIEEITNNPRARSAKLRVIEKNNE